MISLFNNTLINIISFYNLAIYNIIYVSFATIKIDVRNQIHNAALGYVKDAL